MFIVFLLVSLNLRWPLLSLTETIEEQYANANVVLYISSNLNIATGMLHMHMLQIKFQHQRSFKRAHFPICI